SNPERVSAPAEFSREGRERNFQVRRVPAPVEKLPFLRDPRLRRASPVARFAVAAALEAIGDGRLEAIRSGDYRLGVVFSLVNGCVNYSARFFGEVLADPSLASPILFPETVYNAPASHLGALLGATGANVTLVGDSSQFIEGLKMASRWLEDEACDGVVVVGAEEFDWLTAEAFQIFAPRAIFAEGAGALFLEKAGDGATLDAVIGPELYVDRRPKRLVVAELAGRIPMEQGQVSDSALYDRTDGDSRFDADETAAWRHFPSPRISINQLMGEAGGAAVAWQCVLAAASGGKAIVSAAGENESAATLRIGLDESS
ncbi:MAG: hypothetical protein KDM63_14710, partial [Verrucomicrobiae bacterium]|nr:hypothetical protein [Verrucomicrobiae bacterium]